MGDSGALWPSVCLSCGTEKKNFEPMGVDKMADKEKDAFKFCKAFSRNRRATVEQLINALVVNDHLDGTDYDEARGFVYKWLALPKPLACSRCGHELEPWEVPASTGMYPTLCERCADND